MERQKQNEDRLKGLCPPVCTLQFQGKITQREMLSILGVSVHSVRLPKRDCIPPRLREDTADRLYQELEIISIK